MSKEVRVGLIGYRFMGRAHANAYRQVNAFFDPPLRPRLKLVCGRNETAVREFASRFGWEEQTTNWKEVISRPDIDLVDISASNDVHAEIAIRAAEAGKAIFCEKPLARDLAEALTMFRVVQEAEVTHMVCFNYRFFPAIRLAKRLIEEGAIGRIRQFRAIYLQDWLVDPTFPLHWRMRREKAGSGALGDTAVHIVDLARFLVGEIAEVTGLLETFIKERPLPDRPGLANVTVDDAATFLVRFAEGAIGVFETTRMAPGRRNFMHLEVNGEKGTLYWNAEAMNTLWCYTEEGPPHCQGFRRIDATDPAQPYAGTWWPAGHLLGYEHSFVHAVYELLQAMAEGRTPSPSFLDGVLAQAVLEAVVQSAECKRWVSVPEIDAEVN